MRRCPGPQLLFVSVTERVTAHPSSCELGDNLLHDPPVHVREPEVASGITISEALVVNAKKMKNGGVKVVNVHRVLDDVHPQLVGGAINHAALYAAAGQQHREGGVMMVAPRFLFVLVVLADFGVWRSSKFAAPDHQRIVEQPALFEVGDKGGGGLVTIEAKFAVALVVVGVGVPGLVVVADVING